MVFILPGNSTLIPSPDQVDLIDDFLGQTVVVDLCSPYVCLGNLVAYDREYLDLRDVDFHDFRDCPATRELYVYDSIRLGIRRNRSRILIRRQEVVSITRFRDILES